MQRFSVVPIGARVAVVMYLASMALPVAISGGNEWGWGGEIYWGGTMAIVSVLGAVTLLTGWQPDAPRGIAAVLGALANLLFVLALIDAVRGYHRNRRSINILASIATAAALLAFVPMLLLGNDNDFWRRSWPVPAFSLGYVVWVSSMVLTSIVTWRGDARRAPRGFEPGPPPPAMPGVK